MTLELAAAAVPDAHATLRSYRQLAPWGLRELAAIAAAILDASGVVPLNAAARARPSERTIRFYVTRGLVSPPEGRGTAATYGYRHLLQVLAIKLRQMEGATLEVLGPELAQQAGDVLERRVAAALGEALPEPARLALLPPTLRPRGRVGRAAHALPPAAGDLPPPSTCRRLPLAPGVELTIDARHPLARLDAGEPALVRALQEALDQFLPVPRPAAAGRVTLHPGAPA